MVSSGIHQHQAYSLKNCVVEREMINILFLLIYSALLLSHYELLCTLTRNKITVITKKEGTVK